MKRILRAAALFAGLTAAALAGGLPGSAQAAPKKNFKLAYTVYIGFMPFAYLKQSGIMKKWADKYGIDVEIIQANDYVGSVNQFIAGEIDAVGVASMDGLTMPAAGGVDTSVFLITDYSNGNDIVLSKTAKSVKDFAGQDVYLLQYSVSHYLLNRALEKEGVDPASVKTVNISDSEVSAAFVSQPDMKHAVSWKPLTEDMLKVKGTTKLFDSSQIPGEIMDVFIGKTDVLKDNPDFARAVTGAWYEALGILKEGGAKAEEMRAVMTSAMGTDAGGLQSQLDTTHFFYTPAEAYSFLTSAENAKIWNSIRTFCFQQGLFGQGATSVDSIGIEVADGTVLGDKANIKFRINATFAKQAADGKL
ncbi:NitT/TauT family transport system substrate-binding protein [Angulomicrobium tetraedrale]|uniref:NitT/TauT family transport system substrate-binding protein n=1 Tax=Ancylobacter tetraedralis TaxID=217068 RepID=A0A839Z910_9HYPH|nr:putative urea ABC transporter substrate-binding protein [Ancylobacter tetraedralis]MBB3770935.1 NitT/TauT family transport system substrate-binding protein [Ancylobacter tetraedralis]